MKKQNNTSMAHSAKPHKKRPFRLLALLAMLCYGTLAWAQTEWTGSETNGTYTISSNKTINSKVTIGNNDVLNLQIKADVTISRKNTQNLLMFHVKPGGTLNIIGDPKPADAGGGYYKATFVGGSTVILDHPTQYQAFEGDYVTTVTNKMGIVYNNLGNVTIKHARITGFQVISGQVGSRGVINLVWDDSENTNHVSKGFMLMEDVEIDHCWGGPAVENGNIKNSGRIISLQAGNWDATLKNVELHHCFSCEHPENSAGIHHFGGIIRTEGGFTGTFTVDGCRFYNNKYKYWIKNGCRLIGQGGVINWRAAGSGVSDTRLIITNSDFYNNQAAEGGAIATNATIEMSNIKIYNNKAIDGGGVYFWTYNGAKNEYDGRAFDAIFGNGVNIHDNTATQYGGGIYIGIDASDDVGFKAKTSGEWDPENDTVNVLFKVEIQGGATIESNKAPKGAGIAIRDGAPYRHKNTSQNLVGNADPNPAFNQWSGVYSREINIVGGTVCNNTTQGTTGDEMAGAGIYIEKYEYDEDHPLFGFHTDYTDDNPDDPDAQNNSGLLNVNLLSGEIYGNSAVNDDIDGYGGGIYIASVFTADSIVSNLNVTIGHDTIAEPIKIYNNEAYTHGGGIYVFYDLLDGRNNFGTVSMVNGIIGKDNLDTGNKALTGNGGGICVMDGLLEINGGSIEYNTADLDGGGLYVSVPDEWEVTNIFGNTSISRNVAGYNGGGICVNQGTLYIASDYSFDDIYGDAPYSFDDADAEINQTRITKNKALQGDGGGVYLGTGYFYTYASLIYDNAANGEGGGAYIKEGTLSIDFAKILKNTTRVNGGGIACQEGIFTVLESEISHNKALEGNGGGLYTMEGYINMMNYDPDFATIISYNTAGCHGGGIYNHDGFIDLTYVDIADNEAGFGNGGGIYINSITDYGQPTLRAFFTNFLDNKAHGNSNDENAPLGCGGGIFMEKGQIYSEYNSFLGNTAQTSGGGIYCNDGDLRTYSALIGSNVEGNDRGNTATNGKGGGILTHQGNIVIGPCDTYSEEGYEEISYVEHNNAKTDGGGICNLQGDITLIRSGINNNTAEEGKGGGVFITGGNLTMLGGQINNNTANHLTDGKGGGVYSGGGTFQMLSRQPNPIVNLFKFEESYEDDGSGNLNGYNFVYNITHQGLAKSEGYHLYHGISYTTDPTWSDSTYIVCDTIAAGIVEGRVVWKFPLGTFNTNTTYYFKACAWYKDADGNKYYGEMPVLESYFEEYKATGKGIRKHRSPNLGTSIPGGKAMGKASNRPRSIYPSVEENPFFMELTPLQQAIMANTPEADSTLFRKRENRPVRKGVPNDTLPEINNNTATYGGGVYVDEEDAKLIFSGGEIKANFASENGGGIYITQNASMQMKRHCQVVENHVPAGKNGGGIYLNGTLLVGENKEDAPTKHSLKVELNWAGDRDYTEAERNNVFLPLAPILDGDALHKKRVITLLSDISGKTNDVFNTKIGISVDRGFREVIYSENDEHEGGTTSSKQWLEKLMPESGNVLNKSLFDDKQTYYALHVTPTDNLFDEDYIYFWSCWTTIVHSDPNNDGTGTTHYTKSGTGANEVWHINTREGLAWFSSLINGLNGVTANPAAKAFVENDLDMSAHLWVPLGSVSKAEGTGTDIIFTDGGQYSGEFDGQGNIISGLICTYMTGIFKYGLFGTLAEGAKVKNTFVDNYIFTTYKQKDPDEPGSYINDPAYKMGGIAAEMKNGTAVISNCEARGQMKAVICDADSTYVGGIAGDVKQGAIHSCMAMPTITGTAKYMGGLAGNLAAATTLKNSYANVLFSTTPTPTYPVGGIAGVNNGTIENVYVRYNNADNTPDISNEKFYWIAGLNKGSISYCFSPKDNTSSSGKWVYTGPGGTAASLRRTYQPTHLVSGKYGFAHQDQVAETYGGDDNTYIANGPIDNDGNLKGLLASLNNWVAKNSGYTPWTRTMASTINDDYPVLEIADFNVVGTEDGVYMKYDYDVNDMWAENGKNFKALTAADNPKAAMYLYKTNPTAINVTKNAAVPLHIHQNIGITQETGTEELTARVGVTFDNSDGTIANGGAPYDWHMFSSALKAAPLGITYQSSVTIDSLGGKVYEIYNNITTLSNTGISHTNYGNRDYMDPPVIKWNTEKGTVGYFPTNTPYGKWGGDGHWPSSGPFSGNSPEDYNSFDFYCLDEPSRHWINFKREGSANFMDHWHQDIDASGNHKNLKYMNEGTLRVGKGYMMGVSKTSMLMADGILNNGTFESEQAVTNTPYNFNMSGYSEELRGFNLVGNPYHSYLDFNKLLEANIGNIKGDAYYLFDADAGRYICYPADASDNRINAPQFLHPHQGFLVKTDNESCMLTFNNDMRSATANPDSYFREERLNYPLVNLFCHDAAGFYDVTTVEMNRPQLGGGVKLKETRNGNSLIYARLENEDYQTLFAPTGTSTVPVRFEPSQNGVYTLRWDTMHGDFSHLHLIDNLTGADIDLLNQTEYRFEGKVGDYVSRFKLVFEVTDIEEHEQESQTNFAFQFGDELVVNGGGELSVFDVQGRHIMTRSLTGAQSSISLPRTAAGLYILRLAGDKQVKIQKLIIK